MEVLSAPALEAMEAELPRQVLHELALTRDTLVYDPTHCFPSSASANRRAALAHRGPSKHKRPALRLCRRALLVARDGQLPLSAAVDASTPVDATQVPDSLTAIRQRRAQRVGQVEDLTLGSDKGHTSPAQQALVHALPVHEVAALVPTQQAALRAMPTQV
jgi:hypothetical protein